MNYSTYSLDVDGLLADFVGASLSYIKDSGGSTYTYQDITSWHVVDCLDTELDRELFQAFVSSGKSYGDLPLIPESISGIRKLASTGARIVVASHAPCEARPYRKAWLDRYKIPYSDLIVSPNAKQEIVDRYLSQGPILFIDDDPRLAQILGLPREGVDLLIIHDKPIRHYPAYSPSVSSWAEALVHLGLETSTLSI